MQKSDIAFSHIVVNENIEAIHTQYSALLEDERVVSFIKDDFLIEDAKAVIAEAYIAEQQQKFLILGAKSFNAVSQNALLKILEEPPRNIVFILIASSKSSLLPTIRSRMVVKNHQQKVQKSGVDLQLRTLELHDLFAFVKEHEKLGKHEAKALIESLYYQAVHVEGLVLDASTCEAFERGIKLIELNSKFSTIMLNLLMHFVPKRENVR